MCKTETLLNVFLCDIQDYDLFQIYKKYENKTDTEDIIHEMNEFDYYFSCYSPSELVEIFAMPCDDGFSINQKYFMDCGCHEYYSSDYVYYLDDSYMEKLANYCIENNEDFGNKEIRAALDGKKSIQERSLLLNFE